MGLNQNFTFSFFSKDMTLKGDIITNGDLRVEGKIEGSVFCSGKIVIKETAEIRGPIYAQWIELYGYCKGEIYASEWVNLAPKAMIKGNLKTKKVIIDRDANIIGRIQVEKELSMMNIDQIKAEKNHFNDYTLSEKQSNKVLEKEGRKDKSIIQEKSSNPDDILFGGQWI